MSAYGYRPDIDGLRAIAILLVVIYHAFPSAMPNGFVGVDVFFVISGFLITSIIQSESTFSIARFYERRVRRLAPALLFVLASVLLFGFIVLFDDELHQLSKHVVAGIGFSANIVFWLESGYFDSSAELKPLLHLWSLGVEEQFYLIWPIVLLLAIRARSQMLVTAIILLASFSIGIYIIGTDQPTAFFLPFSRVWEMLAGASLACSTFRIERRIADFMSVIGLALIFSCVLINIPRDQFPGWYALLPVLGASLLIASGPRAVVNRHLLSMKPMLWVGLISYPLYLWHWPLISFTHIISIGNAQPLHLGGALVVSFILAALTFALIERPSRKIRSRILIPVIAMITFIVLMICAATYSGALTDIRDRYFPGDSKAFTWEPRYSSDCSRQVGIEGLDFCVGTSSNPRFALVGDSFANHHYYGLADELAKRGEGLINIGVAGCSALRGIADILPGTNCSSAESVIDYVKGRPEIDTVILAGSWYGVRLYNKHANKLHAAVYQTVAELQEAGKQVIFLDSVPSHGLNPRLCVSRPLYLGQHQEGMCEARLSDVEKKAGRPRSAIRKALAKNKGVIYTEVLPIMCLNDVCPLRIDGTLMYRDGHLSIAGSRWVAPKIVRAWEKSGLKLKEDQ